MQNKNGCSLVGLHKAKSDRCIAAGCLDRCPDIVASLSVASENFGRRMCKSTKKTGIRHRSSPKTLLVDGQCRA